MRGSTSPIFAPRSQTVTSVRTPKSRRVAGSTDSSSTDCSRRCCHPCARSTSECESTRPDWPKLRSSGDDNPRSVSYRLDTPTPPAVARRWRRLVSGSEKPSPLIRSPECPADVGFGWNPAATLPPRLDPHRPCQTRDSWYHRNAERADWFRIATHTLRAMHH